MIVNMMEAIVTIVTIMVTIVFIRRGQCLLEAREVFHALNRRMTMCVERWVVYSRRPQFKGRWISLKPRDGPLR